MGKEAMTAQESGFDLTAFGVPEAAVNAAEPDVEEQTVDHDEEVENDDDVEEDEDIDTEDEDDGGGQELDSDTDPEEDDADLKKSLAAAEKHRRDMQSERDRYKAHFENLSAKYTDLLDRVANLEQGQSSNAKKPFEGKSDHDYLTVEEARRELEAALAEKQNAQKKPKQTDESGSWIYTQPDYVDVMKYVNQNMAELQSDPRFDGLSQRESFLAVRAIIRENEQSQLKQELARLKKLEKKLTRRRERVPDVGGTRVRAKAKVKQKMTPLEKILSM